MTFFADSAALVKLYVPESQHEVVRSLGASLVIAGTARVEVPAAFWRKYRLGEISVDAAALFSRAFEADLAPDDDSPLRLAVLDANDVVLDGARNLVARHPLRAYDAIQLSSALVARQVLDGLEGRAAFDRSLRTAAVAEGLRVVPEVVNS